MSVFEHGDEVGDELLGRRLGAEFALDCVAAGAGRVLSGELGTELRRRFAAAEALRFSRPTVSFRYPDDAPFVRTAIVATPNLWLRGVRAKSEKWRAGYHASDRLRGQRGQNGPRVTDVDHRSSFASDSTSSSKTRRTPSLFGVRLTCRR